jgi:hypothetical protein
MLPLCLTIPGKFPSFWIGSPPPGVSLGLILRQQVLTQALRVLSAEGNRFFTVWQSPIRLWVPIHGQVPRWLEDTSDGPTPWANSANGSLTQPVSKWVTLLSHLTGTYWQTPALNSTEFPAIIFASAGYSVPIRKPMTLSRSWSQYLAMQYALTERRSAEGDD